MLLFSFGVDVTNRLVHQRYDQTVASQRALIACNNASKVFQQQSDELTLHVNNYVETLLGTAKTLADDGDLPGAVNVLQDATRSDKRIDAQIATYKNQYKQKNSRCCRKASR